MLRGGAIVVAPSPPPPLVLAHTRTPPPRGRHYPCRPPLHTPTAPRPPRVGTADRTCCYTCAAHASDIEISNRVHQSGCRDWIHQSASRDLESAIGLSTLDVIGIRAF
eukprot:5904008-Pyramimonas_sp.AAC.1